MPNSTRHATGPVLRTTACPTRRASAARALRALSLPASIAASALLLTGPDRAHAVDGCEVLLCLSAADWRSIPRCEPPVRQALRDMARGRPFPRCAMAGSGNSAEHAWAHAPAFCPPQYTRVIEVGNRTQSYCDFHGAISVTVNGAPYARTWWNLSGDAVTEFSPAAKAALGQWNTRFDEDLAAWQSVQPTSAVLHSEAGAP